MTSIQSTVKPMRQNSLATKMMMGAAITLLASSAAMAEMPMQGHPSCGGDKGEAISAKMETKMAEHQAKLKADLKITPAQEKAWQDFTAQMGPPRIAPLTKAECDQLKAEHQNMTAPARLESQIERLDFMKSQQSLKLVSLKTFYAQLTPEQQKIFDTQSNKMHKDGGQGGGFGKRMMDRFAN